MSDRCSYFRTLIKDELAGELTRELQSELQEHLDTCEDCAREKMELSQVFQSLGSLEDAPVPGHFFVYEKPKMSFWELLRNLAPGARWATASLAALVVCMFGFVILNVQFEYREGSLLVSFGDAGNGYSEHVLEERIAKAVDDARAEDRLLISRFLEGQTQLINSGFRNLDRKIDTGLVQLEERVENTVESSNRKLKTQVDRNILQFGEQLTAQQQTDLMKINNRLDQIVLEGRRRDTRNQTVLTTLAQYSLTGSRSRGVIYD
jgi:hypothetical protein